jgi:putative chitinase
MSHLTLEVVSGLIGKADAPDWYPHLAEACEQFEIDTPERVAPFLAECAHESGGFVRLEENLNYSAEGLRKTFGKYFPTEALARQYARKPEAIANRVYANRMGNGDEASGDGWRYRGRGLPQLTGLHNYELCGESLGVDLLADPDLLTDYRYAALSAAWFWHANDLNRYADVGDFVAVSAIWNVGRVVSADKVNGMDDRLAWLGKVEELMA